MVDYSVLCWIIGFLGGIYIGWRLGCRYVERSFHVVRGKAAKDFYKNTVRTQPQEKPGTVQLTGD